MVDTLASLFPHVAETAGITVRVAVSYLADQSSPAAGRWFWSYHIRLENGRDEAVQLLGRYWMIHDARGHVHEVRGAGVLGDTPRIAPGESYDYVSGCPLDTPTGSMAGQYHMVGDSGATFDVAIPRFALLGPAD
ncbi:MAG: Co2+/Mg2+ efflux protein ApaG [Pseudomonadota bacterium]|nr:Co2+/Mg2+ efflux protein ApaG [Pseudomonadota bacterium]